MKAKIFILIILFISIQSNSQNTNLSASQLKIKLVEFLIQNKDIGEFEIKNYDKGKSIFIHGSEKDYANDEKLMDGIYNFGQTRTHSRVHFVIVKKSEYEILNLSTREDLDKSIKKVMDFAEEKKYCVEITNEYINRMMRIFYKRNLNPGSSWDNNCVDGVKNISELP